MNNLAQKLKTTKVFSLIDGVILVIMVLVCIIPLIILSNRANGQSVRISYDDTTYSYALNENCEIKLKDGAIVIKIEDGKVWVQTSDCANGQCKKSGKISKSGESIVCLPNALSVKIEGDDFDASTGGRK